MEFNPQLGALLREMPARGARRLFLAVPVAHGWDNQIPNQRIGVCQ